MTQTTERFRMIYIDGCDGKLRAAFVDIEGGNNLQGDWDMKDRKIVRFDLWARKGVLTNEWEYNHLA